MPRLLIVASSRWGYLWQRHQSLAVAAAEDGWTVDYLQPHPRNLTQVLSFPVRMLRKTRLEQTHTVDHQDIHVLSNKKWLNLQGPYDLAIVYLPDLITEWLLRRVAPRRIVYDAVLDWAAVPRSWYPPIGWRSAERRIARLPNAAVSTDSGGMAALLRVRGMSAEVIPPAADDVFLAATPIPWEDRKPRALYFGAIRAEVDTEALRTLTAHGAGVDVVGVVDDPEVRRKLVASGVQLKPPVGVSEIAGIAQEYRAILLPYRGARSASLVPAKLYNALATGAWVLAKGIDPSMEADGLVHVPDTAKLVECTLVAINSSPPPRDHLPRWGDRWRQLLVLGGEGVRV